MLIVDHEMQQNAEMSAEKDHPRTIRWLPSLLLLAAALVVRRCCSRYYPPPVLPSVVVVTGASSGIGRHAAVHLADQGFTVLAGVRKQADAESLKEEGLSDLHPIILDVTKDEDIRSAVRQAQSYGLPVVGLINNAGVGYPMPVELVKMERVRDVFEVNVLSLVALVKAFTPLLRASKGRIINLGSVTGTLAAQSDGIYAASKHAVEGLTDAMRLELRKWDISVSLIIPGQVESSMWDKCTGVHSPARDLPPEQYELYRDVFTQVDRAVASFMPTLAPARVTSAAIHHALTSQYPKTRYLVAGLNGVPLWLIWPFLPLIPDRLLDNIKLSM